MTTLHFGPRYFGPRWDAPLLDDECRPRQVPTPIGEKCYQCGEPVVEGDRGLVRPLIRGTADDPTNSFEPIHLECDLRTTIGHQYGVCPCTGYGYDREAGRETLRRLNDVRAAAGLGPM